MSTTDHISAFIKYLRKKWEYNEALHQLYIDLKKVYDSVWREVLYNILTEFVWYLSEIVKANKKCV